MVRDLKDTSCDVRLKELGFNLAKRRMRRDLFGIQSDLKDTYKGDGAKFFLVIADVVRRDSIHKLQTGRFQLDIKKTKCTRRWCSTGRCDLKAVKPLTLRVLKISPG